MEMLYFYCLTATQPVYSVLYFGQIDDNDKNIDKNRNHDIKY